MIELSITFIGSAFLAGILMFLAPCTLPLVPAFLAFISGLKFKKARRKNAHIRRLLLKNTSLFTLGFTVVFISFGLLTGYVIGLADWLRQGLTLIGGVFVIALALSMFGLVRPIALFSHRRIKLPSVLKPGTPKASFLFGVVFALGWTPCVGPILSSILLLVSTLDTIGSGLLLLLIFSLGFALPFFITALFYTPISSLIARSGPLQKFVNIISGLLLLGVGLVLLFDDFGLLMGYGYQLFRWFDWTGLFGYL